VELSSADKLSKLEPVGEATFASPNLRVGRDFLARRSWLIKNASPANSFADALIVDDNPLDTERLASSFRLIFGRDISVRLAKTVAEMCMCILEKPPEILLIDDNLDQRTKAETTFAKAQSLGYFGPIIIISGMLTRQRLIQLGRLGAVDIIHKDDLDSTRLREALLKITDKGRTGT
jgi:DNA-binding NarL/FixJ family response regulator